MYPPLPVLVTFFVFGETNQSANLHFVLVPGSASVIQFSRSAFLMETMQGNRGSSRADIAFELKSGISPLLTSPTAGAAITSSHLSAVSLLAFGIRPV